MSDPLTLVAAAAAAGAVLLGLDGARRAARDASTASPVLDRHRAHELDLVDLTERITRDLRSGIGLRDAVHTALADAPSLLPEVALALSRHATLVDALGRRRSGDRRRRRHRRSARADELDLVVHALLVGAEHPHVAARVLDRTTTVVRERRTWRHERIVQAAQARTSARVLTWLPAVFALWGVTTSPSVRAAYTSSTVGPALAALGAALNVAGWWWMRRIVRGAT